MKRALLLALVAFAPLVASAATAYKCVDAKGAISFQDQPCRAGTKEQQIHLREFAPPPEARAATAEPEPEYAYDAPDVAPPPPPPRIAPPKFYLCTRYDGTRYMSDTGEAGSALVPLGVLGVPGRSLADAYGGPNGIGVSAPGLRTIPHQPAASVPFGGMSTWIDDECHVAAPAEACAYLRNSLDDVNSKLRRAFSDTQAQLQQQQADLQQRLRGC
jgi:hypothetical protein